MGNPGLVTTPYSLSKCPPHPKKINIDDMLYLFSTFILTLETW